MQRGRENKERLQKLATRIAAEQDHDTFYGPRQRIQGTRGRQRVAERL
jgi:hypothetical protein